VQLAAEGKVRGSVLDVGCGTGENAMFFAGIGLEVLGVDTSPAAIEKAKKKAPSLKKSKASFTVADALHLETLGRKFDTITDSGLFHTFSDDDRVLFERSLRSALRIGSIYFVLCFSDKEPARWGRP